MPFIGVFEASKSRFVKEQCFMVAVHMFELYPRFDVPDGSNMLHALDIFCNSD